MLTMHTPFVQDIRFDRLLSVLYGNVERYEEKVRAPDLHASDTSCALTNEISIQVGFLEKEAYRPGPALELSYMPQPS